MIIRYLDSINLEIIDFSGELTKYPDKALTVIERAYKMMYIPHIVKPHKNNNLDSITRIQTNKE